MFLGAVIEMWKTSHVMEETEKEIEKEKARCQSKDSVVMRREELDFVERQQQHL